MPRMIIKCTDCSTRYLVDPKILGPAGRIVRCAKCGHSWHENPPEQHSFPNLEPEAPEIPVSELIRTPRPIPRGSNLPAVALDRARSEIMGWAILAAVAATVITGVVVFRDSIAEAWPPSGKLYAMLGFDAEPQGRKENAAREPLTFVGVNSAMENIEDSNVLVLRGKIVNPTSQTLVVPAINAFILDQGKETIFEWSFKISQTEVAAGGSIDFETQVQNPPAATYNVNLIFAARR